MNYMKNLFAGVEIFAFSGKIGTGKNYLARTLSLMLPPLNTLEVALAAPLKIEGIIEDGLDRNRVFGDKDEHTRLSLQNRGFDRRTVDPDIWIKYLTEWMLCHMSSGIKRFIITDVRFVNEVNFLVEIGAIVFRVVAPIRNRKKLEQEVNATAPGLSGVDLEARITVLSKNTSETTLDDQQFARERVLNNDGPEAIDSLRDFALQYESAKNKIIFFVDLDDTICECYKYYRECAVRLGQKYNCDTEKVLSHLNDRLKDPYSIFSRDRYGKEVFSAIKTQSVVPDPFAPGNMEEMKIKYFFSNSANFDITTDVNAYREVETDVVAECMKIHQSYFEPLEGAIETVKEMSTMGDVIIVTIGKRYDQVRKIAHLGLQNYIRDIESVPLKVTATYNYLLWKYPAKCHLMFGDSLEKDIHQAEKAGMSRCYHINSRTNLKTAFEYYKNNRNLITINKQLYY